MAGISNYLKDKLLNHVFRTTAYTAPANVDVALFAVMPNDAGTGGTELSGTGYSRESVPTDDASWSAPAAGSGTDRYVENLVAIDFGSAGSDWAPAGSECVGFALYEGGTSNYLGGNTFASPVVIQSGNPVRFAVGALDAIIRGV
jgi:hypothetical protein